MNSLGVPGTTVRPVNGSKLVPEGRRKYASHNGGNPSRRGMKVSEMFPVLTMRMVIEPHSPGVEPVVETPCAETLNSFGRTFCS